MPKVAPAFAVKLRELRAAAGISQYELAKRSGLSKQAISNLELGNREPAWATVVALAHAFGVSCEAFMVDGQAEKKPKPGPRQLARKKK
jgi:transcriptional regulator with XRE-family HTH domain